MKKLLLVSLSAFAGAVLAVAIIGPPLFVHAGPPPVRETRTPGDTNCDGKLDMSDAIFTLNYLFQGMAFPPCPLADPPALVMRIAELEAELVKKSADLEESSAQLASIQADLAEKGAKLVNCKADLSASEARLSECRRRPALPVAGQTKCYNEFGAEILCDSTTCPGQDGFYRAGCPIEGRFIDNGDGTVMDSCTGLMWQKTLADINGDGEITSSDQEYWCKALQYCENLVFAGYSDWRLPSIRELYSLVDHDLSSPALDPVFDISPDTSACWSSTTAVASPNSAWALDFSEGMARPVGKSTLSVRAVRGL